MIIRSIVIVINLGLLGLMGWGLFQQITTQQETNQIMAEVHENIRQAHQLTTVTNEQLKPLRETADVVEEMNGKLDNTLKLLAGMNVSLANVQKSEQKIVQGLDQLNKNTGPVMNQLGTISRLNDQLLALATRAAEQTRDEYGLIQQLYDMTGTTIQEVAKLNRKFAWLGYLP